MTTEPAPDDGIFASIWNQHGGKLPFRIGLCALAVSMALGIAARLIVAASAETVAMLMILSMGAEVVAAIALACSFRKYGALKAASVPLTEGEPTPFPVRWKGRAIGPFMGGAGEIRLPAGRIRVLNWRAEPWEVVVAIGIGGVLAATTGGGWQAALLLVGVAGLPRRRAIVEDLRIEELTRVEVGPEHVLFATSGGEPFAEAKCALHWTKRANLIAHLRTHCPDVLVVVEKPKWQPAPRAPQARKPKDVPTAADLDTSLARIRALRDTPKP